MFHPNKGTHALQKVAGRQLSINLIKRFPVSQTKLSCRLIYLYQLYTN